MPYEKMAHQIFTSYDKIYRFNAGVIDVGCSRNPIGFTFTDAANFDKRTDVFVSNREHCYALAKMVFRDYAKRDYKIDKSKISVY